jgi:hypothetical protein
LHIEIEMAVHDGSGKMIGAGERTVRFKKI